MRLGGTADILEGKIRMKMILTNWRHALKKLDESQQGQYTALRKNELYKYSIVNDGLGGSSS